jgi:hypothetical protein
MGMGGFVVRSSEKLLNFDQGLALEFGVGGVKPFVFKGQNFAGVVTLAGETGVPDRGAEERPVELLAGLRWIGRLARSTTAGCGTNGTACTDFERHS